MQVRPFTLVAPGVNHVRPKLPTLDTQVVNNAVTRAAEMTCGLPFCQSRTGWPHDAGGVKHRCQREASQTQERTGQYGELLAAQGRHVGLQRITVNHYN